MKLNKLFIITTVIVFLLIGCFSSYQGQGSFSIDFGDISTGITKPDGTPLPEGLYYTIELTNGPGPDIILKDISANDPPQTFNLTPGKWTVTIKAFYEDGIPYAEGTQTINIKAGNNGLKEIKISDGNVQISFSKNNTSIKSITLSPLDRTETVSITIMGLKEGDEIELVTPATVNAIEKKYGNGTYDITFTYNGNDSDPENRLDFDNYDKNIYKISSSSFLEIIIHDGRNAEYPIPVRQDNIEAFNAYITNVPTRTAGLGKHYKLKENIDLDGIEWIPNGTYTLDISENITFSNPFIGSFDGGNYSISNLTIDSSNHGQGFFGYISTGTVKNLTLVDVDITGGRQVGGIAGHNEGTIENCFVSGTITGTATVGGIAGHNGSASGDGIINKCGNTGNVTTASVNPGGTNYSDAGGIAGYNSGTVSNSYNLGNVSSSAEEGLNVGGVVGYSQNAAALVEYCYNTGKVSGKAGYVGGIVGWNSGGTVSNSVSLGTSVTGSANATDLGRVIGSNAAGISSSLGNSNNNYARSDMTGTFGSSTGPTDKNGQNITSSQWTSQTWWTGTALFTDPWWTGKLPPTVPAIP